LEFGVRNSEFGVWNSEFGIRNSEFEAWSSELIACHSIVNFGICLPAGLGFGIWDFFWNLLYTYHLKPNQNKYEKNSHRRHIMLFNCRLRKR